MNVNIQSQGIAGGHNSGSCGGYANYLEHENKEKVEAGMEDQQIPFFNPFAEPVGREEVVKSVDMNTGQLHRDDAKFYSVILSFSDEEVKALGNSRDEVLANVHNVVESTMDLYAENFHCEGVESHADLKYYYTIHEYRDGFTPGLHVHIIVSRKDATNTFKLSPRTNHRRGSSGVIKRGFDRDTFYRSCERVFDKATGFDRSLDKSYDYFNTMKHGSIEQRELMIREVCKDSVQEISDAIIRRVESMVNEAHAPEMQRNHELQAKAESAEKKNMNGFWNTYHSYYRPLLDSVKESCSSAFTMYAAAKDSYGICSEKISAGYDRLNAVHSEIKRLQSEMKNAITSKACIGLFSLLIAAANPAPAIVLALVGSIVADAQKRSSISQLRDLRAQARRISADIERLKVKQEGLKAAKADTLKSYIAVKDERENLKSEIGALRELLEKGPAVSRETLRELGKLIREGGFMDKVAAAQQRNPGDVGVSLYEIFHNSDDRISLDLNLLTRNMSCDPVYHANGGVADFLVTLKGEQIYASDLFKAERLVHLLDKWESMTGQTPAYKIKAEQDATEKAQKSQQHREPERKSQQREAPQEKKSFKMKR